MAENFFEDFNQALHDPEITSVEGRRRWAERLASHFAPSERVALRPSLQRSLADFDAGQERLDDGERLELEIVYTSIEVAERSEERAMVRLVEGKLRLRHVRELPDGNDEVLSESERPLAEVLGLASGLFPVVQVNRRWFLTEG